MPKKHANQAEAKLREALKRLDHHDLLCLDLETSGLDWRRNHIVGWVLTFGPAPEDSYYIPFRHAGSGNVGGQPGPSDPHGWDGELHPAEKVLVEEIDRPGRTVFGHNLAFDLKFGWRAGMRLKARFEDTIINAPLLDEWQGRFSLEACANVARVAAKKGRAMEEHLLSKFPGLCDLNGRGDRAPMAHYWRLDGDDPVAVEYAEGDGTTTWQLRDWQMPQIEAEQLDIVHDIECRLIPILARMSCRGIRADEERLQLAIRYVEQMIDRLEAEFWPDFNAKSPEDVEKWLTDQGTSDWQYSPGRLVRQPDGSRVRVPQKSFTEKWLKEHPHGKKIIRVRKFKTLLTTFLQPLRDTHIWNGRVHPEFNQLRGDEYGTVTGRLSCSNPNLQAASKHDKEIGSIHRSIFMPDEGQKWATVDYSQIEPRLTAFYTGARVLQDGYRATPPIDAHTSVSMAANKKWFDLTPDEQKHYRNNFGKRINQTVLTGGGAPALVKNYGVAQDEVEQLLAEYHAVMPELRPFQKTAARSFRRYGHVLSLLGRRARLENPDKAWTAMNRLLQCGNADIIKLKMVEVDDYLNSIGRPEDISILNSIHDDLCYQFSDEQRPTFDKCLEIMVDFSEGQLIHLDGLPVDVDVGIGGGGDWAQATYSYFDPPPYLAPVETLKKAKRRKAA